LQNIEFRVTDSLNYC